jgi:hypothetical protein
MKRVPARRRHWFVVFLILACIPAAVSAQTAQPASTTGTDLTSDFKYLVNNTEADTEDIITSPLHIGQAGALLKSPRFYLVLAGAGVHSSGRSRSIKRRGQGFAGCRAATPTWYKT